MTSQPPSIARQANPSSRIHDIPVELKDDVAGQQLHRRGAILAAAAYPNRTGGVSRSFADEYGSDLLLVKLELQMHGRATPKLLYQEVSHGRPNAQLTLTPSSLRSHERSFGKHGQKTRAASSSCSSTAYRHLSTKKYTYTAW